MLVDCICCGGPKFGNFPPFLRFECRSPDLRVLIYKQRQSSFRSSSLIRLPRLRKKSCFKFWFSSNGLDILFFLIFCSLSTFPRGEFSTRKPVISGAINGSTFGNFPTPLGPEESGHEYRYHFLFQNSYIGRFEGAEQLLRFFLEPELRQRNIRFWILDSKYLILKF